MDTKTDANGNVTRFGYDRRGLQTSMSAPEGVATSQRLDAMGDAYERTDGEGRISRTTFDQRRRQTLLTNPAGEATVQGFDLNNKQVLAVRPGNGRTEFVYDQRNWLASVTEPLGRTSLYERDNNGNLTKFTDGENHAIVYGYDKMNRRDSVTYADGAVQTLVFDKAGNQAQHIDANGVSVTRVFDVLNRETRKTFSGSTDGLTSIVTTHDENGNALTVTENYANGPSRVTTSSYDRFDRELMVTDGFGAQMAYAYDANGNRKTLATQDAKVTRYGYDGLNRLTGLSSAAGSVQYRHDKGGLIVEQVSGNGTTTQSSYDLAQRPKKITLSRGATRLNLTEYAYDINGNRTEERINRPAGVQVTTYGYDGADRLTSTVRTDGADSATTRWTYDKADNRLTEIVVSTGAGAGTVSRGYTYDGRNQLRTVTDSVAGSTTLTYDPQGNLSRKVKGSDTTAFVWNARDLLDSVSRNGTVLGRYSSDFTGMRVQKEALDPLQPGAPPRVLRTQWDDENALQDRDVLGNVIARYDFAGGHPVALWSAEDGNQMLHADALGSIVATTATDGSVKSETLYDAWGNPTTKAGASANKFAFTGHQADAETGFYYFKARYYDPEIGRFISVDPAEGQDLRPPSYHKYLYAYGNPLVYIDPDGRVAFLADAADLWKDAGDWLRDRATQCQGGAVCAAGAATIGVARGVAALGEFATDGANILANMTSLALGRVGLNSEENMAAHTAELNGTAATAEAIYNVLGSSKGRSLIVDKAIGTVDRSLGGESGPISDVTSFLSGLVGGGEAAASKVATAADIARKVEQAAAQLARKAQGSSTGVLVKEGSALAAEGAAITSKGGAPAAVSRVTVPHPTSVNGPFSPANRIVGESGTLSSNSLPTKQAGRGFDAGSVGATAEAAPAISGLTAPVRKVPNPDGRYGKEATRVQNEQIAQELERRGWTIENMGSNRLRKYPTCAASLLT